jgi:hypothetical protein
MINMEAAGLRCLIARDLNQAYSVADDSSGLDKNTDAVEERINVKSTVH